MRRTLVWLGVLALWACGEGSGDAPGTMNTGGTSGAGTGSGTGVGSDPQTKPGTDAPGNASGGCTIPPEARPAEASSPRTVVGDGSAASCTGAAFVTAVAKGGIITFNCGADPVTITLSETAKIFNDTGPEIVIDGGNKVTLSGGGKVRILYMNTCDQAQKWTTAKCDNQDHPRLTIQNLTFVDGSAKGDKTLKGGGGAIYASGGRLKILNSRFFHNVCDDTGADVGGGAVRAFQQHNNQPLYVVNSTFGGAEKGQENICSNGAGLSAIGVSYTVINSVFIGNKAIGNGANPAKAGTPGGGSGGAIYNDGNEFTLSLCGTRIENNSANEGGGAIFFVSNNRSGSLILRDSTLKNNPSKGFETSGYPGIFVLDKDNKPELINSTVQ